MKNAKSTSEIFKDQQMSPEQSVVYWTEYVIHHKGASHLKSNAFELTWYQYYLLDVILAILIFVFIIIFVTFIIIKLVLKYFVSFRQPIKIQSD
jgi:glucuronosyltransferase